MMDPNFINATSVSLLQRMRNAQQKLAPKGCGCRFIIYSPWIVHPDNEMAKILDQTDGHIRWCVLSDGGAKSRMGKVRAAWRKHLALASDEELRHVLAPIRVKCGPTLDDLAQCMNLHIQLCGLKPVQDGAVLNPYDDLARKFIERGRTSFTRKDLEDLCRREGLWVGRAMAEPDAVRLGIRSFWRFAEQLEDETDATLCLLRHFNGRAPKDPSLWSKAIAPEVEQFLRRHTSPSRPCHIRLQTHGTIAFLAGWVLDPKSGVDIVPVQDSMQGRHIWRPQSVTAVERNRYPMWTVGTSARTSLGGNDIILAISVTHNIQGDVATYASDKVKMASRAIHFCMPETGSAAILDGTHARLLAEELVARVRKERSGHERRGALHVFFAAPNGLMFLFGRLAHSLGSLVIYEHDFEAGGAAYEPSISVQSENSSILETS
jgi:hypothetical protein